MELRDAIREERSISVCLLNYKKSGIPFWNALSIAPIRLGAPISVVQYYIGIQVDITGLVGEGEIDEAAVRSIAKNELFQAAQLAENVQQNPDLLLNCSQHTCAIDKSIPSPLAHLLNSVAGSFVLSDPNLPDCPMVYCSPGFLKLTGFCCDELVGKNCRLLQGPETNLASVQAIRDGMASERAFTVTLLNYKKDKTPFMNCIHIAPIRCATGKIKFFVGVQLDLGSGGGDITNSANGFNGKRTVAVGADVVSAMLLSEESEEASVREEGGEENEAVVVPEPTGLQLLQQKGVVGAVRVAARTCSTQGVRRAVEHQAWPGGEFHPPPSSVSASKDNNAV